ncbi:hypothetical protein QYM36_008577 [Artemia franciscana]|uniref:Reverse transcriptase domain-containing protein n=1 Tax=Artemia franciscana TaxID=6661 RepID=A0AA88HTW6_ARTSF|nr:hypothetical protein QYM36_008577 [Artemia franciscana]
MIDQYADVFEGIGQLPGVCKLTLKEGAIPTVQSPKRVPFALEKRLKAELDRLEQMKIIEKVTKPTDWVNSVVIVEKANGNLRICLDPVDLNKNLKRPHYPVPTFESITERCAGAKIFSKLDATSGFWSMMLNDESSDLTTFNAIHGCYKFKRYPFGLNSAQDDFQRKMEEAFENINLGLIVDDIVICGANDSEHDERLKVALERAREKNVKFNQEKCVFGAESIPYFGNLLTSEGIKPNPEKTRAITEMSPPENSEQLQKLLGMLNYLSKYITKLVLSKQKPKRASTEIKVDASKHGLGAVLAVDDNVVAFGSRSTSETEQRYSQIEKELLAVVFGCKHFHQYIYGRTVTITTDHKPLESILVKPISKAPPRLQRKMLSIQPYSLKLVYRPGSEIPVADTLSRLHTPNLDNENEKQAEVFVHTLFKNLPISDGKMEKIRNATCTELRKFSTLHSRLYLMDGPYLDDMPYSSFEFTKQKKQGIQKSYHDRKAKSLTALKEGQPVWVKLSDKKRWERALPIKVFGDAPRSYLVKTQNGSTYRRNRRHIRPRMSPNDDPLGTETDNTLHPSPRPIFDGPSFGAGNVSPFATTPSPRALSDPSSPEQAFTSPLALRTPWPIAVPPQSNEDVSTQMPRDTRYTSRSGRLVKPVIPFDL